MRQKARNRTLSGHGSPRCAVVRHDSRVPDTRPHTRTFSEQAREDLGEAIRLAREGAGHPYRPSFADFAGPPLGVRSLLKLEKGEPVGAPVYEAAGRALGRLYEDWSVEVPLRILRGDPAPVGVPRTEAEQTPAAVDSSEPMPDPDMDEYLRAVIKQLRKQGVPHQAIMRAVARIVAEYEQSGPVAEGDDPNTPRGWVS